MEAYYVEEVHCAAVHPAAGLLLLGSMTNCACCASWTTSSGVCMNNPRTLHFLAEDFCCAGSAVAHVGGCADQSRFFKHEKSFPNDRPPARQRQQLRVGDSPSALSVDLHLRALQRVV